MIVGMHHAEHWHDHRLGAHAPPGIDRVLDADIGAVHGPVKGRGVALFVVLQLDQRALSVRNDHIAFILSQHAVAQEGIEGKGGYGVAVSIRFRVDDFVLGDRNRKAPFIQGHHGGIAHAVSGEQHVGGKSVVQISHPYLGFQIDEIRLGVGAFHILDEFHYDAALVKALRRGLILEIIGILHGGVEQAAVELAFQDDGQGVFPHVQVEPGGLGR